MSTRTMELLLNNKMEQTDHAHTQGQVSRALASPPQKADILNHLRNTHRGYYRLEENRSVVTRGEEAVLPPG